MEVQKKAEVRRSVEKTYERLVEFVMRLMRKRTTTDNFELMQFGKQLLGEKFAGVYSSDQRPALSKNEQRCALFYYTVRAPRGPDRAREPRGAFFKNEPRKRALREMPAAPVRRSHSPRPLLVPPPDHPTSP